MKDERFAFEMLGNRRWVCIRPQKSYSVLSVSLREHGFRELVTLLRPDDEPAEVRRDEQGRIWCTGMPEQSDIVGWALDHENEVCHTLARRVAVFADVRDECSRLDASDIERLGRADVRAAIHSALLGGERLFREAFCLILLTGLLVDQIGELFRRVVVRAVGNKKGLEHITELFRTPYAREAAERRAVFLKHESRSEPGQATVPNATTNIAPASPVEGEVVSAVLAMHLLERAEAWREYGRLRLLAPLLVQFNDEQAYLWRAYTQRLARAARAASKVISGDSETIDKRTINEAIVYIDSATIS